MLFFNEKIKEVSGFSEKKKKETLSIPPQACPRRSPWGRDPVPNTSIFAGRQGKHSTTQQPCKPTFDTTTNPSEPKRGTQAPFDLLSSVTNGRQPKQLVRVGEDKHEKFRHSAPSVPHSVMSISPLLDLRFSLQLVLFTPNPIFQPERGKFQGLSTLHLPLPR